MAVDDLLFKFGDMGRYQLLLLVLMWLAMCSLAFNNLISLFVVSYYPHRCKASFWNETNHEIILPNMNNSGRLQACSMVVDSSNESFVTNCIHGWVHYPPENKWSIVQEWNLVCEHHYLAAMTTSVYFAGVMCGAVVFGYLADTLGRKIVLLFSLYVQIIIGIATAFSTSYSLYTFLRFLHGFVLQGGFAASFALAVEFYLPHRRTVVAIILQSLWPTTLLILAVLSNCVGNWSYLHLYVSVPGLIYIFYYWVIYESPRWLLSMRKTKKLKHVLERLSKWNRIPALTDLETQINNAVNDLNKQRTTQKHYGIGQLFRKGKLRTITVVTCYMHFVAIVNFYGIVYSIPNVGGSMLVSFGIGGAFEVCVCFVMFFVLSRFGRRKVAIFCMLMCGTFCLITFIMRIIMNQTESTSLLLPSAIVAFMGRAMVSAYFTCIPIYASELFPTVFRTLGAGMCSFFGRLGGIISPQLILLEKYGWYPLPFLIFAMLAFTAALVTLLLPETLGKPLPEFPEDVEKLWDPVLEKGYILEKKMIEANDHNEEQAKLTEQNGSMGH